MYDVADVNADFKLDPPVGGDVGVALGQAALDFDRALRGFQSAPEFNEKSIADGFDLDAVKTGKNLTEQSAVLFQQLEGELIITLSQGAVAHHVGEHDGGEF